MYDKNSNIIEFSGAYNPLVIIRDHKIISFDGDRMPIGIFHAETSFTNQTVQVQKNDPIYMFSDGYIDQFGGAYNKKLKRKQFKELILTLYKLPLPVQKERYSLFFSEWIGDFEQVDDILLLGLKV